MQVQWRSPGKVSAAPEVSQRPLEGLQTLLAPPPRALPRAAPPHPSSSSPLHRTSAWHPWGPRMKKLRSCPRWVDPSMQGPGCGLRGPNPGFALLPSRLRPLLPPRNRDPHPDSPAAWPGLPGGGVLVTGDQGLPGGGSGLRADAACLPHSCTGSPWSLGCANRTGR